MIVEAKNTRRFQSYKTPVPEPASQADIFVAFSIGVLWCIDIRRGVDEIEKMLPVTEQ